MAINIASAEQTNKQTKNIHILTDKQWEKANAGRKHKNRRRKTFTIY